MAGPDRQTTPDFLTSMTSPKERYIRPGYENIAPSTPEEFALRWQQSQERQNLLAELDEYERNHSSERRLLEYKESRTAEQTKGHSSRSPYTISYIEQVLLNMWRAWRRLLADPSFTIASLLFNLIMALILGTAFFNLRSNTSSFY